MSTKNNNVSDSDTTKESAAGEKEKVRYKGLTKFTYVGPSLPGGRLKSNTILEGTYAEITEYYKEAIELYPNVANLIVPVSQLAESRVKIKKSGNLMYNYYTEVDDAIKPEGEE